MGPYGVRYCLHLLVLISFLLPFITIIGDNNLVTIDGDKYSIEEAPPVNSPIVRKQEKIILEVVNFKTLVRDLTKLGQYIRMASVGVTTAGHTELQIEVQKIGVSVATLGRKIQTAFIQFRDASTRILEHLQTTYHFLLLSKEEVESALRMLKEDTKVTKDMLAVAQGLQVEFETEKQKVLDVLEQTVRAKGLEQKKKEMIALQLKEFDVQKAISARKKAIEAEEKHWKLFQDAEREQQYTGMLRFPVLGDEKKKKWQKQLEMKKKAQLKYIQEQLAIHQEAVQHIIAEYMNCTDSSQLADNNTDALEAAVSNLEALSKVMTRVAHFCDQMHKHVEMMQKSCFVCYVEEMISSTKEERMQEWNSPFFLKQKVHYCAQWVALHSVCTQYMMELEHVYEE